MSALGEIIAGLLGRRPHYLQVGAICLRRHKGKPEVLLISSLGTGRWIIPKGWPMKGRSLAGAALQEAWEEAGIRGKVRHTPLGSYFYLKMQDGGMALRCEVRVFAVETDSLSEHYPEAGRREREWVSPEIAAERVAEEGLKAILRAL
ncbi:NUDIX hydrolase [Paenirhodobacter sp. CAU 1674]|jgi:8-oxo-dGTP pyrophosphatase MutT (NUDIX family)|uniref:NUDIX hydrolase n=1 Tax=Paenirhodobacter sp. CAU 1674 TaxID=3032596 RepID=UPI0023DB9FB6|nr:NUDIX hydrolase [Paenirhodobacter sp. CAU 1674]MDF2141808.1 NUDIX hydrolase [Paenirhodobacter sp. CAU 1674]